MRCAIRLAASPIVLAALFSGSVLAQGAPSNNNERWDGFYSGANLGGAFGGGDMLSIVPSGAPFLEGEFYPGVNSDPAVKDVFRNTDVDFSSFTGGAQAGFLTSSNGLVYGIEADINVLDVDEAKTESVTSQTTGVTYSFRNQIEMDYIASLRARVGVPIDNWLVYATAGLALTTIDYSHEFNGTAVVLPNPPAPQFPISERASERETKAGWTLGGGVEVKLSPSWSLRTEYSYTRFGTLSSNGNKISPQSGVTPGDTACGLDSGGGGEFLGDPTLATPRQCFNHDAEVDLHSVRLGLNYQFNQSSNALDTSSYSPDRPRANWSGPYVGLAGGHAEHRVGWEDNLDFEAAGWIGGALAGYNYQIGNFVLGLEGSYSEADKLKGDDALFLVEFTSDVDEIWTAGARVGWAWDRLLIYGRGGYANGLVTLTGLQPDGTRFKDDDRLNGWTLGAGIEHMLTRNVVIGLEYAHIDLGSKTFRFTDTAGGSGFFDDVEPEIDTVTGRLSYKFSGLP